jgi:hypothetical protein
MGKLVKIVYTYVKDIWLAYVTVSVIVKVIVIVIAIVRYNVLGGLCIWIPMRCTEYGCCWINICMTVEDT